MAKSQSKKPVPANDRMKTCVENLKKTGGKRSTYNIRAAAVNAIEILKKNGYGKDDTEVINRVLEEKVGQ